jgi:serine/threonine protein kinase
MGHAQQAAAPNVYGRYETLFRIAAGGMAEVYAARVRGEAGFQKLVALKRMLPHLTDDDRFVTMFMDEGRLAANISSPNVVSTLDLGRIDDGSLYLVMELVVGTTLSTLLRNVAKEAVPMPIDVAVELIAQAAQGLHDAHDARTPSGAPLHIVHRDISPQNVLVGVDGRVRITDFGVARAVLRRTKTSTGEFKGKLSYFSPEQCADGELDRRSDIFSLGVVAWETLTTRRLFHAENPLAVLERVTRMPIPLAHEVSPEVPEAVSAVVAKALERDRERRFTTSSEFARALRRAARQTVGSADPSKVAELVARFGGESLETMQAQLRSSLSERPQSEPPPDLPGAKTEISSGVMFRAEDGSILPAIPQPAPLGGFHVPDAFAPAAPPPREERGPSKLPFIVAGIVVFLGLGAGATVGILAAQGDGEEEAPFSVQSLPEEDEAVLAPSAEAGAPAEAIVPPAAEAPAPTPVAPEPAAVPAPEPQAAQAPVEPAQAVPAGAQRTRRHAVPTPEVRPLGPSQRGGAPQTQRGSSILRPLDF